MPSLTTYSLSVITFSLILGGSTASSKNTQTNCSTLYLLHVVPYPDDGENAGWDRGLDLVPAGHLAADQINNHTELLSGYKLELIDLDSESCGRSVIPKAVVNLHTELVSPILSNRSPCLVGIIGLYCSIGQTL